MSFSLCLSLHPPHLTYTYKLITVGELSNIQEHVSYTFIPFKSGDREQFILLNWSVYRAP